MEKHAGLAASREAFLSVAMALVSLLLRNPLRALIQKFPAHMLFNPKTMKLALSFGKEWTNL